MNPAEPRSSVAQYLVTADAEASVMPRMLELFARRGLVPDRFEASRNGDTLTIQFRSFDFDAATAAHLRDCVAGMVHVRAVRLLTGAAVAAA